MSKESPYEKVAYFIANHSFTKPDICGCDFDGNWLGDGICIGCRHLTSFFDGEQCQHETTRPMMASEVKQTILEYLRELDTKTETTPGKVECQHWDHCDCDKCMRECEDGITTAGP